MASKESLKKLKDTLHAFEKKQLDIKDNLKKLDSTKKEQDAKPIMETLYEQLRETMQLYEQANKELKDVQDELGKKLGKKEEKKLQPKQQPVESSESPDKGRNSRGSRSQLTPDEQELTYELKAQLMRNIEMQNHKLKTELTLHETMTESKALNQQNKRLHEDASMSKTNTLRMMKMFQKKAKEADEKLKEMQKELIKSQQLTKKYQQLFELERRKLGGSRTCSGNVTPVSADFDSESPKLPPPSSYSLLGNNMRVNDIIRKNEFLIEENDTLKREIQRLKHDNATLIKKTKVAMSDKDEIIHRLETSESNRKDLSKRLSREKTQYQLLSRSLTRQASDWILLKKQLAQFDEEYRWSQVQYRQRSTKTPQTSHTYGHSYLPSRATTNKDRASQLGEWSAVYRTPREKSVVEMSVASSKPNKDFNMLAEWVRVPKPKRERSKLLPII